MKNIYSLICLLFSITLFSQENIRSTNPEAHQILIKNYNASNYPEGLVSNDHNKLVTSIADEISPDSLKSYIISLESFKTRHSASDTLSETEGIGAARKWAFDKFNSFNDFNNNRLVTSYLAWDERICSSLSHKNIFSVLPGKNSNNGKVIIIEAHIDSRCRNVCDFRCLAPGIEDNASGTALVLELARVMSKYEYDNTIVFLLTIGEEQGLFGANAFAQYVQDNNIDLKAVLNNDVIGGIICGETSSKPSCPGLNDIDSTQVRLFSRGNFNSPHKQLARYIKLQYQEELLVQSSVPMQISIMTSEDRQGRGGDHIPFRERNYPAMRFTSANEHGDASNGTGYDDRQHTTDDIAGLDTNMDGVIDSFFVDFNYLSRNAIINACAAVGIAQGPDSIGLDGEWLSDSEISYSIKSEIDYPKYKLALRTLTNDWDTIIESSSKTGSISISDTIPIHYLSVAAVDDNNVESLFSEEIKLQDITSISESPGYVDNYNLQLLANRPNPFDEATTISVAGKLKTSNPAFIVIRDLDGKEIQRIEIELSEELNEVTYTHGYGQVGTYLYSLEVDGKSIATRRMVFAN